jgi:hypothetical protein
MGVPAIMAADAVREFIDQIEAIPKELNCVDVLIHSMGGDALTAWKLMATLRERFEKIGVLVPFAAFSAATVFSLGADEIVMTPYASLGPIDPQISVRNKEGIIKNFAYEDLGAFLNFLRTDVGLTEQPHLTTVIEKLFSTIDPLIVGGAKRASELSTQVGERLLSMHLKDERKAKQIAVNLNKSFFSHGDAVTRKRARDLELKVAKSDEELEDLIWKAYLIIEESLKLREPYNPLCKYLSDPAAEQTIAPTKPLSLPPNTPAQAAQQVWNNVIATAMQNAQGPGVEVPFEIINAIIESVRIASEFRTKGKISAVRLPSGEIKVSTVNYQSQWYPVQLTERADN